jgi:hypothetical protein
MNQVSALGQVLSLLIYKTETEPCAAAIAIG